MVVGLFVLLENLIFRVDADRFEDNIETAEVSQGGDQARGIKLVRSQIMENRAVDIQKWLDVEDVDGPDSVAEELLAGGEMRGGLATDLHASRKIFGGGHANQGGGLALTRRGNHVAEFGTTVGADHHTVVPE